MKIYEYDKCSTCKKALKFLDSKKVPYQKVAIVEQPPTLAELKRMLGFLKEKGFSFKKLFNTSGVLYREMQITQRLKDGMSEAEALSLLSKNGKLIKRPFFLAKSGGAVGFNESEWKKLL